MIRRFKRWRRRRWAKRYALRWVQESQAEIDRVFAELAAIHAEAMRDSARPAAPGTGAGECGR